MDDVEVGARVKELREAAGLTQADLARAAQDAGWTSAYPQTIVKVEQGARSLKLTEAVIVAQALGVPTAALAGRTGSDDELMLRMQLARQAVESARTVEEIAELHRRLATLMARHDELNQEQQETERRLAKHQSMLRDLDERGGR